MREYTPLSRRTIVTLTRSIGVGFLLAILFTPVACAPKPFDSIEPFSRDRIGALRRSTELTLATLDSAVTATLHAFDTAEGLCSEPGESLDIAYATARGEQSAARGRQQSFVRRVSTTRAGGEALFEEWRAELREYHDESVAQASRESLERLHAAFASLMSALDAVQAELLPALIPIEDRVLYLKHSRNEGPLATRPAVTPFITGRLDRVRTLAEEARRAGAEFEAATAGR